MTYEAVDNQNVLSQMQQGDQALKYQSPSTMASTSRIIELARSIAKNAAAVDAYLQENGLSERAEGSSDIDTAPWMPIPDAAADQSRQSTMAACEELRALLGGPVLPLVVDWTKPVILRLVTQLRLAELVPLRPDASGTPFSSVAAATRPRLDESCVRRILRHAAAHGIFCEPTPGFVAHTPTSALLVREAAVRDLVAYGMFDMLPAGMRLADALQRFPGSLDPRDTGSALANLDRDLAFEDSDDAAENGDAVVPPPVSRRKSLWQVHSREPEVARRFHAAMTHEFTDEYGLLGEFFGEARIEGRTIVDVGGGQGGLAVRAAGMAPTARFVVQDSEENCQRGRETLPPELRERVRFMAHDFFSPQPVKDADIYLFRWILHDWSDDDALKIIRGLVPALRPGARVLLNELVVPMADAVPREVTKAALSYDLAMMALFNGKERKLSEWQDLFHQADQRFEFVVCRTNDPKQLSLIEFIWNGQS